MTHPLEELAKWHDDKAANDAASFGDLVNAIPVLQAQLDRHRRFAAAIRSAVPDCECGELVREKAKYPYDWFQASCIKTSTDHPAFYTVAFRRHDTKTGGKYRGDTLSAAVAAAKGTP